MVTYLRQPLLKEVSNTLSQVIKKNEPEKDKILISMIFWYGIRKMVQFVKKRSYFNISVVLILFFNHQ